jgi:hypothetical protein
MKKDSKKKKPVKGGSYPTGAVMYAMAMKNK